MGGGARDRLASVRANRAAAAPLVDPAKLPPGAATPCYAHVMSAPSGPAFSSRTERLLSAPVLPMILRLSAPGLLLVAFTTLVSIGDTYFVGRLGTEPLAGLALVFPMLSLLQMTSAGAMGGGVSSAIARAL